MKERTFCDEIYGSKPLLKKKGSKQYGDMDTKKIIIEHIPTVSNTALMTLYCRAMDYQAKSSILKDKFSYDLFNRIQIDWKPIKKKLRTHDFILTAIRGRKIECVSNF